MTQTDAVRALDAAGMAKLSRSRIPGTTHTLTSVAICTPVIGSPIPNVRVLVDRGVQTTGPDSEVVSNQTKVTVFHVDIDPDLLIAGFQFALDTGEVFKLDAIEVADESLSVCIVVAA